MNSQLSTEKKLFYLLFSCLLAILLLTLIGISQQLSQYLQPYFLTLDHQTFFVLVSLTADIRVYGLLWLALAILAIREKIKKKKVNDALLAIVLATVVASTLQSLLKFGFQELRPCGYRCTEYLWYSFPSGHSTRAGLLGAFIIDAALASNRLSRKLKTLIAIAALSWMGLVALSRLALNVHWFHDVLAGLLLGSSSYLAVKLVVENARETRETNSQR